jgi:alpha-L-fucosidase
MLPAPHPVIDKTLPGRTSKRDLIGELADALRAKGMPLLVYYNHSCNGNDDPEWRKAVGYDGTDKSVLATNLIEIVAWMSKRYKDKIKTWWFDSPYSLDLRGPHNSVTTDNWPIWSTGR